MEQFSSPGKGAVYRFCTSDCPTPTPKVPRAAILGQIGRLGPPAQSEYTVEKVPSVTRSVEDLVTTANAARAESVVAEAEAYLRNHPLTAPNALIGPEETAESKAPVPPPLPTTAPGPTGSSRENSVAFGAHPRLQRAQHTAASNGILFKGTQDSLSDSARQVIADLVAVARTAERINLRGYDDSIPVGEDEAFDKLSIARSLAVRQELIAAGVEKDKIRILYPRRQLVDITNPTAPINRSVLVTLVMPDGRMVKPSLAQTVTEVKAGRA